MRELKVNRMLLPRRISANIQMTASHLRYRCKAGIKSGEPSLTCSATEQLHAAHLASGAYWPVERHAILSFLQKPLKGLLKLLVIILQTGMQGFSGAAGLNLLDMVWQSMRIAAAWMMQQLSAGPSVSRCQVCSGP